MIYIYTEHRENGDKKYSYAGKYVFDPIDEVFKPSPMVFELDSEYDDVGFYLATMGRFIANSKLIMAEASDDVEMAINHTFGSNYTVLSASYDTVTTIIHCYENFCDRSFYKSQKAYQLMSYIKHVAFTEIGINPLDDIRFVFVVYDD